MNKVERGNFTFFFYQKKKNIETDRFILEIFRKIGRTHFRLIFIIIYYFFFLGNTEFFVISKVCNRTFAAKKIGVMPLNDDFPRFCIFDEYFSR